MDDPSLSFFVPLNTTVVSLWSLAFPVVAEHESVSPCLYQSSVLSLDCVQSISLEVKIYILEVQVLF